jgi:hypothetical protein
MWRKAVLIFVRPAGYRSENPLRRRFDVTGRGRSQTCASKASADTVNAPAYR